MLWSVRNVNLEPSKYGRNNRIAQFTARNLRCALFRFPSFSVKVRDAYPIGRDAFPFSLSWRRAHLPCFLLASVCKVYCLFCFGKKSTGGDLRFSFSGSNT